MLVLSTVAKAEFIEHANAKKLLQVTVVLLLTGRNQPDLHPLAYNIVLLPYYFYLLFYLLYSTFTNMLSR